MGWRNRLQPLTKEQQVMLQKASKQLWPFYNVLSRTSWVEFLHFETGLWLEGNHGTCSLMLPWSSPISGATQKTREAAISPHWLHIFCPPSFNYKWPNYALIFKTNSPACTLKYITSYLFKDVSPAKYSHSDPNCFTTTFIQAKPLNHLSVWSLNQPLNCCLCLHSCPSSPPQFILNMAVLCKSCPPSSQNPPVLPMSL